MPTIASSLTSVKLRIQTAEKTYGRPTGTVSLLAVSKGQTVENIQQAAKIGQQDFGENYLQEALKKIHALENRNLNWHYIGQIQSNKTRDIASLFSWVHSIDKLHIAERLNQQRPPASPPLNICLQINIDAETTKAGFTPSELDSLVTEIANLPRLKLRGFMTIPAARSTFEEQRRPFRQLKELLNHFNQRFALNLDTLSMGMSDDLEAAVAEGATIVRIGTAIFGPRPQK